MTFDAEASSKGLSPNVWCVVLNWNGAEDTVACLDALKKSTYANLNVLVVDNGSTDDSLAKIRAGHPGVLALQSKENIGFAGGNNIGIRYASYEFFFPLPLIIDYLFYQTYP